MTKLAERTYRVNQLTPDPAVVFDPKIAEEYLRYARMLAARGVGGGAPGERVGADVRVATYDHDPYPGMILPFPQPLCASTADGFLAISSRTRWTLHVAIAR